MVPPVTSPAMLLMLAAITACAPPPDAATALAARLAALDAACMGSTATFDACRTLCAALPDPSERDDCFFQLAERAPRWASGDARHGIQIAYDLCRKSQQFTQPCLEHALQEVAITCTPDGRLWLDDAHFDGGETWRPWRGCLARIVLEREQMTCLPAVRDNYHHTWRSDDRPLCGL